MNSGSLVERHELVSGVKSEVNKCKGVHGFSRKKRTKDSLNEARCQSFRHVQLDI